MKFTLVQRRTIWCPTLLGWVALAIGVCGPVLLWWFQGEAFLSTTQRLPADVLVVEGWIGRDGLEAAKVEFEHGGYHWLVTSGGLSKNDWNHQQWNYAREAGGLLVRLGLPADQVLVAPAQQTKTRRTFESAVAVRQVLEQHGLHPAAVNIFTLGAHARRSRLVYAKVLPDATKVGVVSFLPAAYGPGPWWKSSERADELIKETVGYLFEVLLNSGRWSNSVVPGQPTPP